LEKAIRFERPTFTYQFVLFIAANNAKTQRKLFIHDYIGLIRMPIDRH